MDDAQIFSGKRYRFSRDFRHAMGQATVPVVASELFNLAHECPLLFERKASGWSVVAVLADPSLKRETIGADGGWRGEYAPLILRIHPFRRSADDTAWEIDPAGLVDAPLPGKLFLDGTKPSADFIKVVAVLNEAAAGRATLAGCAEALEAAGFLVPLGTGFDLPNLSTSLAPLFCIDAPAMAGSAGPVLARLAQGAPAPLELAVASVYSLRHLAGRFATGQAADFEARMATLIQRSMPAGKASPKPAAPPKVARDADGFSLDASAAIDFSTLF